MPGSAWQGSLNEAELSFLKRAVEITGTVPGPVIEIGPLFGFTTAMLDSWAGAGRPVITADNFWNH